MAGEGKRLHLMNVPFTQEQLLARAETMERQVERWKGNPGYADTLRMDAWALRTAAALFSPEIQDWFEGTRLEAGHQVMRFAAEHDAGKTAFDWFWLIGYLAQKAATAAAAGDFEKAKHHTISTAAALLNWHRHLAGDGHGMRPGIDPVERGLAISCAVDDARENASPNIERAKNLA
ncbi:MULTISPECIES: hypothetical protein [unclassified Bradyrhizobium]|uniref:hypothetical protein n=1 Tax=Bradyrhizobium sp. USDA 4541 TaxID=2817704 RepID=UPI0020A36850|nr:hypothetical protein [Bradyrhizobium sp. USDA 4541]MCP1852893.1 hypothetical protein [Bradyrhizobium sp. USDA 4541]